MLGLSEAATGQGTKFPGGVPRDTMRHRALPSQPRKKKPLGALPVRPEAVTTVWSRSPMGCAQRPLRRNHSPGFEAVVVLVTSS